MSLSPVQHEAATHVGGPTLISSGAGSGKTRTMVAKAEYLIREMGYNPKCILGVTFTNKAASEMVFRLVTTTGYPRERFFWFRTFHSAMLQILKFHTAAIGFKSPVTIYDTSDSTALIKRLLLELNIDPKLLQTFKGLFSRAKNSIDPVKLLEGLEKKPSKIVEAFGLYRQRLKQSNVMDFDDILQYSYRLLLENPEVREKYRSYFEHILVDEHQDSNGIMNHSIDLLVRDGNITVVGDFQQSIYSWRAAEPKYFLDFPHRHPGTRVFSLERNYRSTRQIVDLANRVIARNPVPFEEVVFHIERGDLLDIVEHPNQERYRGQRLFIVNIDDYGHLVLFIESEEEVFLKTVIPSRKATKKYLKGKNK